MFSKLITDRHGGFAIFFAIAVPALLATIGLAIDYSNIQRLKTELQVALDATSTAAAKNYHGKPIDPFVRNIFDANLDDIAPSDATLQIDYPSSQSGLRYVSVSAELRYETFLMDAVQRMFGQTPPKRTMRLGSKSSIPQDAEVVLVLDNSGSMYNNGFGTRTQRIQVLRESAKELLDTLATTTHTSAGNKSHIKLGIVPFNTWVNVGTNNRNASWMDTKGISPIHHENLDWEGSFPKEGTPQCVKTERCIRKNPDGSVTAIGVAWGKLTNTTLTRFTILQLAKEQHTATNIKLGWHGCVESRPVPHLFSLTAPSQKSPASLFVPMFHPDEPPRTGNSKDQKHNDWWSDKDNPVSINDHSEVSRYFTQDPVRIRSESHLPPHIRMESGPNGMCTVQAISPLMDIGKQDQKRDLHSQIGSMQPHGETNIPDGMIWGLNVLSPNEPFAGATPFRNANTRKFMIVLTDGANKYPPNFGKVEAESGYGSHGYHAPKHPEQPNTRLKTAGNLGSNGTAKDGLDAVFERACTEARQEDVIVMTVALDLDDRKPFEKKQIGLLDSCASNGRNGKRLSWNATSAQLPEVFREIASQIMNLRVVN